MLHIDSKMGHNNTDFILEYLLYILIFPIAGMGRYDPGIRREIFDGMRTTKHGLQELNGNFISANPLLKCDSQWSERIYHTFDEYVRLVIMARAKSIGGNIIG